MDDLAIPQAANALDELAAHALIRGDITFLTDESGRRIAAVVPVPIAEQAVRLRAEAEAIEVGAPAS
ncbi:hypothetical protein Aph01nite_44020 [Acrocarpospora phusangensis]|uniref:Uncharacterized protein n=1 Tax=Acrocarpospora phusangensis TaxID=1070424 RepID=A0A919QBX7_9ACTN|nr:hypothetical protein [Acrocarpospora phusangensis]GIH26092.1 hypothetical protein Aph01nite_44020 [Acrocarpospora phusangensis]